MRVVVVVVACACFFFAACPPPAPPPVVSAPVTTPPPPTTTPAPPPPKPTMNLTFGPPKVSGAMSVDAVVGAVTRSGPALSSCVPVGGNGTVVVKLLLKGDGSVAQSSIVTSELKNPAAETCITGQTKGWAFSKPRGGIAQLEVPVTFATR